MPNSANAGQTTEEADRVEAFSEALWARLHPRVDLYGIDAKNEAHDQIDDIITLAERHLGGPMTTTPAPTPAHPSEEASERVVICETPSGCTCGAPASTPRGMHHDYCTVHQAHPSEEGDRG